MKTKFNKNVFKTPKQYWAFRGGWATAVNADQAKSTVSQYGYKKPGCIGATHTLLFNLLCDKPIDNGFTEITNSNKLLNGMLVNQSLFTAAQQLQLIINYAKQYDELSPYRKDRVDAFLQPLNQHLANLTAKMLSKVKVPKVSPVRSSLLTEKIEFEEQVSRQITEQIRNAAVKRITPVV